MDTFTHMSSSQDALVAVLTPRPRPVSSLIHNTYVRAHSTEGHPSNANISMLGHQLTQPA